MVPQQPTMAEASAKDEVSPLSSEYQTPASTAETEAGIEAEVARATARNGVAIGQKRDQQTDFRDKGDGEVGSLGGEIGSLGAAAG